MHPAQKQAIYAMLSGIETQVTQVKLLLGFDAEAPAPQPARNIPTSSNAEYVSDEEEKQIDDALESARQDGLKEAELIASAWKRQQAELNGVGVAF